MTTTVKVHVNGKYRATVTQDDHAPVEVEGNYNGGSGEMNFYLTHPANSVLRITEIPVTEEDERWAGTADIGRSRDSVSLTAAGIKVPPSKVK